jgi:hypothetical protein
MVSGADLSIAPTVICATRSACAPRRSGGRFSHRKNGASGRDAIEGRPRARALQTGERRREGRIWFGLKGRLDAQPVRQRRQAQPRVVEFSAHAADGVRDPVDDPRLVPRPGERRDRRTGGLLQLGERGVEVRPVDRRQVAYRKHDPGGRVDVCHRQAFEEVAILREDGLVACDDDRAEDEVDVDRLRRAGEAQVREGVALVVGFPVVGQCSDEGVLGLHPEDQRHRLGRVFFRIEHGEPQALSEVDDLVVFQVEFGLQREGELLVEGRDGQTGLRRETAERGRDLGEGTGAAVSEGFRGRLKALEGRREQRHLRGHPRRIALFTVATAAAGEPAEGGAEAEHPTPCAPERDPRGGEARDSPTFRFSSRVLPAGRRVRRTLRRALRWCQPHGLAP